MSAQPSDSHLPTRPAPVARTVKAVRTALPEPLRVQFAAELDEGNPFEVFERWWLTALAYANPASMAEAEKVAAGTFVGTPAEVVFGQAWTRAA